MIILPDVVCAAMVLLHELATWNVLLWIFYGLSKFSSEFAENSACDKLVLALYWEGRTDVSKMSIFHLLLGIHFRGFGAVGGPTCTCCPELHMRFDVVVRLTIHG